MVSFPFSEKTRAEDERYREPAGSLYRPLVFAPSSIGTLRTGEPTREVPESSVLRSRGKRNHGSLSIMTIYQP